MDEIDVKLTSSEAREVREVLQRELDDMRVERRRTDAASYREQVKHRMDAIERVLHKLPPAA